MVVAEAITQAFILPVRIIPQGNQIDDKEYFTFIEFST